MRLLQALSHLIAPRVCRVCGCALTNAEEYLCLGCLLDLPRTAVHKSDFNIIHQRLGHSCKVDRAAGWFYYKRNSPYAQLLVDAKYGDLPRICRILGQKCASELMSDGFFDGVDCMVPMPMHWTKQILRGYNQAYEVCKGIQEVTAIPIVKGLVAARSHGVQSRHSRTERYQSISGTLTVKSTEKLVGKHILFVDDIITTGASASESIRTLHTASPAAVSVLSLGLTASNR